MSNILVKGKRKKKVELTQIKKQKTKKLGIINQQYSYTTREALATFKDMTGNFKWLASKEGLTIEQWWVDRISQQRSASNLTKPVLLGCFGVHGNTNPKLDDEIRTFICEKDIHQVIDFEDDGAGKEWIRTDVSSIYKKLNFYPKSVSEILNNEIFLKEWFTLVETNKKLFFDVGLVSKVYKLRPWQNNVVSTMISSRKKYHQLGLPPRHGKTLDILDYTKRKVLSGEYDKETLYLVPASKSLSSNASFVTDYNDFGFSEYFNILTDVSLFVNEDKIIEKLKKRLPPNSVIFLVTDEADLASHTTISVDKIELIKKNFTIGEQFVMTGTGIGKAAKIFETISIDDINFIYQTYDEMVELGGEVTKRNFINVQYDIENGFDENVLNIRQSISDPAKHIELSKYLYDFTINTNMESRLGLQKTEIVMIFIKPEQNKYLTSFVDIYQNIYSDKVKCMTLVASGVGKRYTNRNAEKSVKDEFNTMRKNDDTRKLIVFSAGIGSRSFSVKKIYRVVDLTDSYLTPSSIQEFARGLTFENGKSVSDIIRIGFTPMELAEQLYLVENEIPNYDKKSKSRIRRFLNNNSFSKLIISDDGNFTKEDFVPDGTDGDIIGMFLDNISKFTDSTSYLCTRLWSEGIVVDVDAERGNKKVKSSSVSTNVKNKKSTKIKITKGTKPSSTDEKKLRQYINITRCIPSIAYIGGFNTIDDFLKNGNWNKILSIDKEIFEENFNNSDEFKGIIEGLFRQEKTIQEHQTRLIDYMKFTN